MSKKKHRLPTFTGGSQQVNYKASTRKAYALALLERQKQKQEQKGK
jgi:hypothetical protein